MVDLQRICDQPNQDQQKSQNLDLHDKNRINPISMNFSRGKHKLTCYVDCMYQAS